MGSVSQLNRGPLGVYATGDRGAPNGAVCGCGGGACGAAMCTLSDDAKVTVDVNISMSKICCKSPVVLMACTHENSCVMAVQ
jgi:hypothetical protein